MSGGSRRTLSKSRSKLMEHETNRRMKETPLRTQADREKPGGRFLPTRLDISRFSSPALSRDGETTVSGVSAVVLGRRSDGTTKNVTTSTEPCVCVFGTNARVGAGSPRLSLNCRFRRSEAVPPTPFPSFLTRLLLLLLLNGTVVEPNGVNSTRVLHERFQSGTVRFHPDGTVVEPRGGSA